MKGFSRRSAIAGPLALVALGAVAVAGALGSRGELDGQISAGDPGFGNGAFVASIVGMSDDGQVVAFRSAEPLVAADADLNDDLYMRSPAGLFLLSLPGSSSATPAFLPDLTRMLPDGHVVYGTRLQVVADDTDSLVDLYIADRNGVISAISDTAIDTGAGTSDVLPDPLVFSADSSTVLFATAQNLDAADREPGEDTYRYRVGTFARDLVTDGALTGRTAGVSSDGNTVYLHSPDTDNGCGETVQRTDVFKTTDGGTTITPVSCALTALPGSPTSGVFFADVSPDGARVLLTTAEKFNAGDTDDDIDLYADDGAWVSEPAVAGGGSTDPKLLRVCNDTVVFTEAERIATGDTDNDVDVFRYTFTPGATQLSLLGPDGTQGSFDALPAGVSADCSELLWSTREQVLAADTDSVEDLYLSNGVAAETVLATPTPPGGSNAPIENLFGVGPNLERAYFDTAGTYDSADGDGFVDIYEWKRTGNEISLISSATPSAAGGGGQEAPGHGPGGEPVGATPDGSAVIVKTDEQLLATDNDGFNLDLYRYDILPNAVPNAAPALSPIGNRSVNEGEQLLFSLSATDPDGDPLAYSALSLPAGATFDAATATFSWTPGFNQEGSYPNVHFEVSDGTATDSEEITITVSDVPGGGPDTTAPELEVDGKASQRLKKTTVAKIKVTSDEACELLASGKVVVKAKAKAKKKLKLKQSRASLSTAGSRTMKLKLSKKNARKLKRALKKGAKATAQIKVKATDPAGNFALAKKKIKIKR